MPTFGNWRETLTSSPWVSLKSARARAAAHLPANHLARRLARGYFLHCTVALRTHQPPIDCNTMLGVGVVPFTMESLGAYLFAGAFRFLALLMSLRLNQKTRRQPSTS